jgi:hypothetical protein
MQMTFLNNVRKVGRLVLSRTSCNIILPSMPMSSKWTAPFRLSNHHIIHVYCLPHALYMPHPYILVTLF